MSNSSHVKQGYEKKGLKVDNAKDVERKRLEHRFKAKKRAERFRALCLNPAFIDYMFELLELAGHFAPGEGPTNSNVYEKKGRLQMATKIADDLLFNSDDGMDQVNKIRRAIRKAEANVNTEEQE